MREQILNLLASGAPQEDVLRIVGCSADYIGELLKDKVFIDELRAKRNEQRESLIQQGYARLEQNALNSLNKDAAAGLIDTPALCRVLETVAKNRVLYRNPAGINTNNTLHLTVELKAPQGASAQQVTIDHATSQIVAIGDRSMTAMPITGVQKLFKTIESAGHVPTDAEIIAADLADVQPVTRERREGEQHEQTRDETRTSARAA